MTEKATSPEHLMELFAERVGGGDIGLVSNSWEMTGTAPDGSEATDAGLSADVVRRQPDGSWLVLIDQPRGTSALA